MGFVMICFILLATFFLIISCSDSNKFSGENQQVLIEKIYYGSEEPGRVFLQAGLQFERNCFSGTCTTINDCYWVINGKCCISSKNLGACNLRDYLWIIDNDTISSFENPYDIGYGKHFVKLVLVDAFGDSISSGTYNIQIDEPLKIALLSPVENYKASKMYGLEFQYRISGIDTWEEDQWKSTVYVSTDENVWKNGKALENNFLYPPLDEQEYYWGVKVSNQDTAIYSEIRSVWIEN